MSGGGGGLQRTLGSKISIDRKDQKLTKKRIRNCVEKIIIKYSLILIFSLSKHCRDIYDNTGEIFSKKQLI